MNTVGVAFAGGVLIGLAAVLLMLALGRIAGIAGIIGGLVGNGAGEIGWRMPSSSGSWQDRSPPRCSARRCRRSTSMPPFR